MIRANIQAEPVDAKVHIEVEGKDGQTPHIGEDGNWYIGEKNTGMPSRGEKGNPGYSPEINVTDVPEGHAISIKDADGITHVVNVKDGLDGKDGKNATIEHRWDGSKLFITSSSGISYADLQGPKGDKGDPGTSKSWLIGSTAEITPNDVLNALSDERNVILSCDTEEFGLISFTYFMVSPDGDFIVTSCPVVLEDDVAVLQLTGIISDNTWSFTISPMSGFGFLNKVDQVAMDVDKLKADVSDIEEDVVNLTEEIAVNPADYDVDVLTLDGDCSGMTKDDYVPLTFTFKGTSGTAEVKKQGTSSIQTGTEIGAGFDDDVGGLYNFTIKFPEAFEAKEGWGAHDKYVAKAYPIDSSLLRDVFGATLWGQIVATRTAPQRESESLSQVFIIADPPISETTFVYTETSSIINRVVYKRSNVSGGKLHINFDSSKITNIHFCAMCYDSAGNPYKVTGRPRDAITTDPSTEYVRYISGEQDMSIWDDVGEASYFYIATDSVTIPIPDGCTVQVYQMIGDAGIWPNPYSPDGSIVFKWSSEVEANGTWAYTWARDGGITATVEKGVSPLAQSPNYGAIDGFPVAIVLNGKFYHLSMFNIPKDGWMASMGSGTKEAILCAEGTYPGGALKGDAVVGKDFELEYVSDKTDTAWVQTALNNLVTALNASDGTDLDTTVAQYLDWDSAIDLMAFNLLVGGFDLLLKNYLLFTYDGVKWVEGAYDMDCIFGWWWTGKEILAVDHSHVQPDYIVNNNKINQLIRNYKVDEFKERYTELRAGVMSEGNIDNVLMNLAAKIPAALLAKNNERWPLLRSTNANTTWQMLNWYRLHSQIVDAWVEAL